MSDLNENNQAEANRLDEIVKSVEDENLSIDETLKLLSEAIDIGNEACNRAQGILNSQNN